MLAGITILVTHNILIFPLTLFSHPCDTNYMTGRFDLNTVIEDWREQDAMAAGRDLEGERLEASAERRYRARSGLAPWGLTRGSIAASRSLPRTQSAKGKLHDKRTDDYYRDSPPTQ